MDGGLPTGFKAFVRASGILLTLALLSISILATPFNSPDEFSHFWRAQTISSGFIGAKVVGKTAGGDADVAYQKIISSIQPHTVLLKAPFPIPVIRDAFDIYAAGRKTYYEFNNTAIYPPFAYLPGAFGVLLASLMGLPMIAWLYLARICTGLAAATAVIYAWRKSPGLAPLLILYASFPMALFQMGTLNADALVFAGAAIFAVFLRRILAGERLTRVDYAVLFGTLLVICAGKIAYMPLLLLPLIAQFARSGRDRQFYTLMAIAGVVGLIWLCQSLYISDKVFSIRGPDYDIDVKRQLAWIIEHPFKYLRYAQFTARHLGAKLFFGMIGWPIGLFNVFVPFTLIVLLIAAVALLSGFGLPKTTIRKCYAVAVVAAAGICIFAIFLFLYLQFTPIGQNMIDGVQGRYFLPLVPIVLSAFVREGERPAAWRLYGAGAVAAVSCVVTLWTVWHVGWVTGNLA